MNSSFIRSLAALGLSLAASAGFAQGITGAGSSFAAPIYSKWADAYNKATGVKLNYQSIGSGAGLKQIAAKTVDFGASDMPLTDDKLKQGGLVQFPTVVGGVIPVVHVGGMTPGQMKLTGGALADIYLGKIKRWNDPALKALNPGLNLPDAAISVVRRADGSGTSFIFTNYLSKVSPEWKAKVGEGTAVNWPVGVGGKGNEGVAAFLERLPNSIGFLEYAYVKQNKLPYAMLKYKDGNFVSPDEASFKAAAAGAQWSESFYQILTDEPGKNAWPITGATFVVLHAVQDKPAQGAAVLKFFDWAYASGDAMASQLAYVPLPATVKDLARHAWGSVKDASGKPVYASK
jgi:phosphate transport system substrate-binding protein